MIEGGFIMGFLFFLLFGLVLVFIYLAIRRRWLNPGWTALIGVLASIITMSLFTLSQGTSVLHGVATGIFLGTIFAVATLAIAWYFHSSELRAYYAAQGHEGYGEESAEDEYYE
jgi:hypothetical protein